MATSELAPDYYLRNFHTVLDAVWARYADLLTAEERGQIDQFRQLSAEARKLYVRLLSRKGVWFREDKLDYPEIGDVSRAAAELADVGLVTIDAEMPGEDLGRLLTKPEIRELYPEISAPTGARKADLVSEMADRPCSTLPFRVYGVRGDELWALLNLLFFGTLRKDLTEFVLVDLAIVRYEAYELTSQARPFQSREQVDAWLRFDALRDRYDRHKRANKLPGAVAVAEDLPLRYPWRRLERKRQRLANHIARDLERLDRLDEALALYEGTEQPPSRERRVRVLGRLGRLAEASELCEAIRAAPMDEDEADVAPRLGRQLARQRGETMPSPTGPDLKRLELTLPPSEVGVERATLAHFETEGWAGYYCENALINGLFGLAFWDVIFAPCPDAFHNRYQRGPVDMFTSDFVAGRRSAIDARLREIETPSFWPTLIDRYDRKQGVANRWVNWETLPRDLVERAVATIPASVLAGLMRRLLFDLYANRRGHPDLILFRNADYRWVEVKGPGDRLQRHQVRWLTELDRLGANYRVCHVKLAMGDSS